MALKKLPNGMVVFAPDGVPQPAQPKVNTSGPGIAVNRVGSTRSITKIAAATTPEDVEFEQKVLAASMNIIDSSEMIMMLDSQYSDNPVIEDIRNLYKKYENERDPSFNTDYFSPGY